MYQHLIDIAENFIQWKANFDNLIASSTLYHFMHMNTEQCRVNCETEEEMVSTDAYEMMVFPVYFPSRFIRELPSSISEADEIFLVLNFENIEIYFEQKWFATRKNLPQHSRNSRSNTDIHKSECKFPLQNNLHECSHVWKIFVFLYFQVIIFHNLYYLITLLCKSNYYMHVFFVVAWAPFVVRIGFNEKSILAAWFK